MLRPSKTEIEAVSDLLEQGADSPESLAHDVIQLVERLRGEREQWFAIYQMTPGVYQGYGPYPTRHMAHKQLPSNPMAQASKAAAVVPVLGTDYKSPKVREMEAELASRETPVSHWSLVREWVADHPGVRPAWNPVRRR